MQTLAQWRAHAQELEILAEKQEQHLESVETQLLALQATMHQAQEQLELALKEHARLLHAAQAILGADDSEAICREFISHMNSIIKADSTTLYLIDHDNQIITRAIFHRSPEASNWQLGETLVDYPELMAGLSGRVISTGQPVLSLNPDDGLEPPETLARRKQSDSGSLIIIPLITTTGIIGTVTAHNQRNGYVFTPRDVDLLMTLARQAAAAIQRAQLTDEIKQLAATDALTGLLSRRECLRLAERELARCVRLGQPVSLFMFDVDHFKRINDSCGHPVGDSVLAGIGAHCRASQRSYDIIGRYGGDEFFGLFPETSAALALQIAERICEAIAKLSFPADAGAVSITLSIGIAVSDQPGDTLEALIKRADQALYSAKQSGRNRAAVWNEHSVMGAHIPTAG